MTDEEQTEFARMTEAPIDARTVDLEALVEAYVAARTTREEISDREKYLREIEGRAETALFDSIERQGLKSVRHKTLGLFSLNDLAWPSVVGNDELVAWAREAQPDLLTINKQSLGKIMRDAMRAGDELPPGVEPTFSRKISWRRAT